MSHISATARERIQAQGFCGSPQFCRPQGISCRCPSYFLCCDHPRQPVQARGEQLSIA